MMNDDDHNEDNDMWLNVCSITSALGIVNGKHIDGDDLQYM